MSGAWAAQLKQLTIWLSFFHSASCELPSTLRIPADVVQSLFSTSQVHVRLPGGERTDEGNPPPATQQLYIPEINKRSVLASVSSKIDFSQGFD